MARPVEGDDPVALREARAETEHGFDEVGRGAVQEDDGAARGVALGAFFPVMEPAALDLDEPAGRRIAPLDPAGVDKGEGGSQGKEQSGREENEKRQGHPRKLDLEILAVNLGAEAIHDGLHVGHLRIDRENPAIGL
jgi:hypothetical protein